MQRRPWVFKPSFLLAIVAALAAYCLVAEALDFHLLGLRLSSASALNHRLRECLVLWVVVCSVIGWALYFLKRRPERKSSAWPLLAVPLVAALWVAASEGFDVYRDHVENAKRSMPPAALWCHIGMPVIGAALPLGLWAAISVLLVMQAKFWRRPITLGICPTCEYDLTGNESGVCTECGSGVVTDPDIPYYFYRRRFAWMPELSDFPDAKARFDASQQATKEYDRSPAYWLSLLLVIITVASVTPYLSELFGRWRWAVIPALVVATPVTTMLGSRHMMRRSLRRQLADQKRNREAGHVQT